MQVADCPGLQTALQVSPFGQVAEHFGKGGNSSAADAPTSVDENSKPLSSDKSESALKPIVGTRKKATNRNTTFTGNMILALWVKD